MPWFNHASNAVLGPTSAPNGPDTVEDHNTKMPGTFPSSPPSSPANTKSKRPLSPANENPQPGQKRQKTGEPDVLESTLSDDDTVSCFYDALESQPQSAQSKVGIERQKGFVVGGDVEFPAPASQGGSSGPPQPQHDDQQPASGGGSSGPRIYHNGPEAQRKGGIFKPPPRPIVWPMAPKDMKIEDMPGFRGYITKNGRKYPDFDEDTWEKGFSRTLRKHLSNRFKREIQ